MFFISEPSGAIPVILLISSCSNSAKVNPASKVVVAPKIAPPIAPGTAPTPKVVAPAAPPPIAAPVPAPFATVGLAIAATEDTNN